MFENDSDKIEIDSFNKFINKISKINSTSKLISLMNEFNISNDSIIYFRDIRVKLSFECCSLLASNPFVVRHLVETGSKSFNQYTTSSKGYSGIIFDGPDKEALRRINPDNFLINHYTSRSLANYPTKTISVEFIETMMELFPETLNYDSFFGVIAEHYQSKKIPNDIQETLPRLFSEKITHEAIRHLIKSADMSYRNIYFGKSSVDVIESKIDLYSLTEEKNLIYILCSKYELGMINRLFDKNDFANIFESVFKYRSKNYHNKNPYTGYTLGLLSSNCRLNSYHINNDDYDKVKFLVQQIENSGIDIIQDEYNYILKQALSSQNDCSKIIELFANEFSYKSFKHFDNIDNYFIGDYNRLNSNLKHYIEIFKLESIELNKEDSIQLISNIFRNKKVDIFNDFISSPLFRYEQLDIILDELGKSLSRKKGITDVNKKETLFYNEIIDVLHNHNFKTTNSIMQYLSKYNESSPFRALLERKLLTENLVQEPVNINSKKRRM